MSNDTTVHIHRCERCGGPIVDGQAVTAWALGLTGQFEHVTCPDADLTDAEYLDRRGGAW